MSITGTLQLFKGPLALREPIEAALAEIRPAAVAKDLSLHVELQLADERMDCDAHRLRQVFGQLLSNALKFTPHGGSIWVSARRHETNAVVVVRDSGRGLASGAEQWLFEPFGQADSSNTRRSGGIGLGLALARRLAELHGGRIAAESAGPHLGSTFSVTLPLVERRAVPRDPATGGPPAGGPPPLAGVTALVVDDQLDAREALSALLVQFGASVDVAESSAAGVAAIERCSTPPDVVVCDIAMPEEDGYGFVRRLRRLESRRLDALATGGAPRRTPVIALSAFAIADSRTEPGGFDAYLSKPVDPPQLLSTLARLLPTAGRRSNDPR